MAGLKSLGRKAQSSDEELIVLRKYVEQLPQVSILDGQLIDFDFPTGALFTDVRHSLGRAYTGAFVVGQGQTSDVVIPFTPAAAVIDTIDITNFVRLGITAAPAGSPLSVRLWVF